MAQDTIILLMAILVIAVMFDDLGFRFNRNNGLLKPDAPKGRGRQLLRSQL